MVKLRSRGAAEQPGILSGIVVLVMPAERPADGRGALS
jgi:hypothetical protein